MTDYSFFTDNQSFGPLDGSVMARFSGHTDGWIVPTTDALIVDALSGFGDSPLNAFEHVGSSGTTVTIDTGEALIYGSPTARDTQSSVSLASGTANQRVFVGYEPLSNNKVVVGLDSEFTANARRLPLYEFDTQMSSVSAVTDLRDIGETLDADTLGGRPPGAYAVESDAELITGAWTFTNQITIFGNPDGPALQIEGGDHTDADELVIDGDADVGQDDDLLKVRGIDNPAQNDATDADTVFVTKGYGQVGINEYNPGAELDVNGNVEIGNNLHVIDQTTLEGDLNMTENTIHAIRLADFNSNSNDFIRVSGNNQEDPGAAHTLLFENRDIRLFAGDTNQIGLLVEQDGDVKAPNGGLYDERGLATISDQRRKIYVANSFPGEAKNGDILFKPE